MTQETPTRGERNNNPGNIVYRPDLTYKGEVGIEEVAPGADYAPRFARFDTPVNGIRAIAMDLLAYYRWHGLRTVTGIIGRWAPGSENDTAAYVRDVCKVTGFGPGDLLTLGDANTLNAVVRAIIIHENGRCIYTGSTTMDAVKQALADAYRAGA